MMKKFLWIILVTALMFTFTSCTSQTTIQGFAKEDVCLSIEGAQYRNKDNIETVIKVLGEGYDYSEGLSCAYDGMDKTYDYATASFYTNPLPEGDLVSEIYTNSSDVSTSKGVRVGMSREDIVAVYGDGEDFGNMLVYRSDADAGSLCFEMDGDTIAAIFITTEPV